MPRPAHSSGGGKSWPLIGSRCGRSQWRGVLAPPHPSPLPFPGWSFSMGSAYQFHSWRVFVIVCALPCASSVVALTFMPESPRFLLEVTFIITNTQGSQRHWNKFLLILGGHVCLFRRYIFPSSYRTMKGLVSWRHSFNNQHVKRLPHGLKALMFLLKQVVSLHEENAPYCFIKETLFLELLLHSGYQGVCVSSGMNLNHLHCCTQWDLTRSHGYWKIGEHVCLTS